MSTSSLAAQTALPLKTRNVTAVLGPTNTGKTHLAIERMLAHKSGLIGLPLRLLAREVYDRAVARVGADAVALITGEEKIKPEGARFFVCTVEAMPRDLQVDFLAVDEVQLAADADRGHVFTERLFYARGQSETLLLGAGTMRETIKELLPGANFVSRPRLSKLSYAGQKKLSRLPRRSAIVAFSANDVYEIAELIRRQRGGAAVVLGALSPRTRNAQVALFQAGDVDFIVATDAVGMGLNLDVDHVAFAGIRKFDGRQHRELSPAEIGQIAGRAGRHMNDGTFGVTADVEPFSADLIERLEKHEFDPVKVLQWRATTLDFSSVDALRDSLRTVPDHPRLTRARVADDLLALDQAASDPEIVARAKGSAAVEMLWEACQIPDYRKVSPAAHAELVGQIFKYVSGPGGRIPEDWFAEQVSQADRTEGDIDTLANRIAHIRTWTFVSNRAHWLANPEHWQARTRQVEDALSDALHEQLTQRFIDQRTSTLMRRLRDEEELTAEIGDDGSVHVEKHFVGRLNGFRFAPDTTPDNSVNGKAARNASAQVLAKELAMRARRVASAKSDAFKLDRQGARILWRGEEIGKLERTEDPLKPSVSVLCDEHLTVPDRDKVQARLAEWVNETIEERLKPLMEMSRAEDVTGLARGIAFRLREGFGVLKRESVAQEIRDLDQDSRAQLRKYGVRFGAFNIFVPALLKPAPVDLLLVLWGLKNSERMAGASAEERPQAPRPGLTSVPANATTPEDFYRVAGFHLCGPRAVRVDMLERLSDMIRPLTSWRASETNPVSPPKGASGDGGFTVIPEMLSILGCSAGEFGSVLQALGFRSEKRPKPAALPQPVATPQTPVADLEAVSETAQTSADASTAQPEEAPATEVAAPSEAVTHQPAPTEAPAVEAATTDAASPAEAPEAVPADGAPATPVVEAEPASPSVLEVAAAEPAAAAEGETASPAEPEMIEVWRPRRRRDEHAERRREAQGGRRHGQRRHDRKGERQHQEAGAPAASASPEQKPEAGAQGEPEGKDRERDRDRDRRHHRHRDDRRPREGRPREDRPERQPRGGQGQDRRQSGGREERRQGGYDPSSPFAALSALKAQLEDRRRNQS